MQLCLFFFFSNFLTKKKGISNFFPTSDESWVRGKQEEVLMQGPQARSRQPSWLSRFPISKSLEHFLSSPSLQPNSLPSPAYLLQHSHWKSSISTTHTPHPLFLSGLPPSPTPGSPGPYRGLSLLDTHPEGHTQDTPTCLPLLLVQNILGRTSTRSTQLQI